MARARYYATPVFADSQGLLHKVSTFTVTVYEPSTTTLLGESIYADAISGTTLANPFTVSNGVVLFYLADAKSVNIKFDATASGYGIVTMELEPVWPNPEDITTDSNIIIHIKNLMGFTAAEDLGFIMNDSSNAAKATNKAAWESMIQTNNAGTYGAPVKFNAGVLHMNTPNPANHEQEFGVSFNMEGVRDNTDIKLYGNPSGTNGFLHFASTATSPIRRGGFRWFRILHETDVDTTNPTLALGYVSDFEIEEINIINQGAKKGPVVAVRLNQNASGVYIDRSNLFTRDDLSTLNSQGLIPACVEVANTLKAASLTIQTSQLGGVYGTNGSRGIRFNNTAQFDTMQLINVAIKDHEIGIGTGASATGPFDNVRMISPIIDVCDYAMAIAPSAGASYGGWSVADPWFRGDRVGVLLTTANLGAIVNWHIHNGEIIESKEHGVLLQGAIQVCELSYLTISTNVSEETNPLNDPIGIELMNLSSSIYPTDIDITNNRIHVKADSLGCIKADQYSEFIIDHNRLAGSSDPDGIFYAGVTSAVRKIGSNNTWKAG